ncbi:nucleoside triphosphate pyrophosphohydrolase [Bergeyella zoohelcum]|uniref:Nucleoside triphosphate pyrophosphohydrolase n=1 Tax=Bergeyella zoohelcum ATCC 43767 TaxID=883096 RepID=K1M572_9FLAO|nr:nucleoside triphosphate pyrophosphohydrolase [Bergeyella zoohelcum]EKB57563.1 MazG family protein [Bergeyella zoohelcum ATCC 43767]SUV48767.1 Nucleoside triphosphate pyrophosphohydrolase/pyrophosphatase MazG [Bergeyella zoohelcum]
MNRERQLQAFSKLLDIMDELREKCPWDKKQTMESLRYLTLEEVYELSDGILKKDLEEIKKEIGDVLLHLVFYAKIASEKQAFDVADVIESLNEKLIFRHPHIYGDVEVADEKEVKENWEKLKLKEGNDSVLSGVSKGLPSMIKATRIQEKARGVGFDFPTTEEAWQKVEEEMKEFRNAENPQNKNDELGDVLFSIINYARLLNLNPDEALERTNLKFIQRFQYIEQKAKEKGTSITELSLQEMDEYWNEAKKEK